MEEGKKKKKEPSIILIVIIVLGLFAWAYFSMTGGKKKEPHYDVSAQAYSQLYIKQNYYPDADFPTQRYNVVNTNRRYDVSGKFTADGKNHTFEVIGEFPYANTKEFHVKYVAIDNNIMLNLEK